LEKLLDRDTELYAERRRLYTVPQVVYQTSFSRSLIYNEIAAGRLKSVKLGRAIRIPAEALDAWIASLEARADG
jgi:excisionase family DNA binding protein